MRTRTRELPRSTGAPTALASTRPGALGMPGSAGRGQRRERADDDDRQGQPRVWRRPVVPDGSTFTFTRSDGTRPPDLYSADVRFSKVTRLSDANAWLSSKLLPTSELIAYRDVDGKQLYGIVRYLIGYEKGRAYPTVFEIYETFFDNGFNARAALLAITATSSFIHRSISWSDGPVRRGSRESRLRPIG